MKIKVLNYNIHSTLGTDGIADWQRTAEMIRSFDADVIAIEEIGINHRSAPGVDAPARIAEFLGLNVIFGKTMNVWNGKGQYGIAAFSKYELKLVEKVFLSTPSGHEPRCFIVVKILAPKPFFLIVTHFSFQGEFEGDDDYRLNSAKQITEKVLTESYFPAILCGDLNTVHGMPAIDYLHKHWDICNDIEPDTPTTSCQSCGPCQIDFICTYPKKAFTLESFTITPDLTISDHKPVSAILKLE